MSLSELSFKRLHNQQVINSKFKTPEKLLHWMGAVQAQDYEMSKWAFGTRIHGASVDMIEHSISKGDIIRIHLLRPTWHFAAAQDIRWLLDISAPRIRVAMRSRQKQLGLTKDLIQKSNKIIEKALARYDQMTRSELVEELEKAGFKNEDNRASHLLINAELDKIICSGPTVERK